MFHRRKILLFGFLLFCIFSPAKAADRNQTVAPDTLVQEVTLDVLKTINDEKDISPAKLRGLVKEKILPHLHVEHMARLALGKYWRDATPRQREEYTQEFQVLLLRTYGSILSYARDKEVSFRKGRVLPDDTDATVEVIVKQQHQVVTLQFKMEKTEDGWKMYDFHMEGVSLIMVHRSTFAREIKQGGIDGLIKALREKNRSFN